MDERNVETTGEETAGSLLRLIRKKLKMTHAELEWKSGVSVSQISRIERDICIPSTSTIRKLESAMQVPLMELFLKREKSGCEGMCEVEPPAELIREFEYALAQHNLQGEELKTVLQKVLHDVESTNEVPMPEIEKRARGRPAITADTETTKPVDDTSWKTEKGTGNE